MTAKSCFPANTSIQVNAQKLYDAVQWDWMVDITPGNNEHQFHLAWTPEASFLGHADSYTDEATLVDVLGHHTLVPSKIETQTRHESSVSRR